MISGQNAAFNGVVTSKTRLLKRLETKSSGGRLQRYLKVDRSPRGAAIGKVMAKIGNWNGPLFRA